ncbi:CHAD domain-containing protein [Arthrobacter sp. B3I4]|uniref:CHAD domain-containing protein n=1 Tax=Arthrobacter sp. B3I4 TaxID=3042267 RepID=UPI00277E10D7|nr:CHAD domain-containing protein [Arthrobacter sp. B3I4]MDQ0755179.1 CHAD domain-containing protein [Arthrobacter sp. B3I4]
MATTAGQVLLAYLEQQLAELRRHAPGVLAARPEDVHQMRVAARRLRSLLASGRPLFADGAVEPVRDELRWLSGLLGEARDPGVVKARLAALVAGEPKPPDCGSGLPGQGIGPAARRIDVDLDARAADGVNAAREALASERYARLLVGLDQLLAAAPLSAKAAGDPGKTLRKVMARDERRLMRQVAGLPDRKHDGGPARDAGLHEVRKAAKRLRYAAELAASLPRVRVRTGEKGTPAGPKPGKKRRRRAKRTAKRARKIQELLGQHQDSVVAREYLAELAGRALRSGEDGFSYGRLHAKEESLAAASERAFLKLWNRKGQAR